MSYRFPDFIGQAANPYRPKSLLLSELTSWTPYPLSSEIAEAQSNQAKTDNTIADLRLFILNLQICLQENLQGFLLSMMDVVLIMPKAQQQEYWFNLAEHQNVDNAEPC